MSEFIGNKQKADPNVVPLCDILLVLLIIFMVISPTLQKGLDVTLPESVGESGKEPIVLSMDRDAHITINNTAADWDTLESMLHNIYDMRQVKLIFVRADTQCVYRDVARVLDMCKNAGIANICVANL